MFAFLMTLFVILSVVLAFLILLQQGKGDMGLGSMSGSRQMLFGGSGGQSFFEKATWIIGGLFVVGALGLAILKSKSVRQSRLEGFTKTHAAQAASSKLETKTPTEETEEQQAQTTDEDSVEDNN